MTCYCALSYHVKNQIEYMGYRQHQTSRDFYLLRYRTFLDPAPDSLSASQYEAALSKKELIRCSFLSWSSKRNPEKAQTGSTTFRLSIPKAAAIAVGVLLVDAMRCLVSGSPSRLFMAAIACIFLLFYALPDIKRSDSVPPVELVAFGHLKRPKLLPFVHKFHKLGKQSRKKIGLPQGIYLYVR